jgi:hypothetical protein
MAPEDGDIEGCRLNMEQDNKEARLASINCLMARLRLVGSNEGRNKAAGTTGQGRWFLE